MIRNINLFLCIIHNANQQIIRSIHMFFIGFIEVMKFFIIMLNNQFMAVVNLKMNMMNVYILIVKFIKT